MIIQSRSTFLVCSLLCCPMSSEIAEIFDHSSAYIKNEINISLSRLSNNDVKNQIIDIIESSEKITNSGFIEQYDKKLDGIKQEDNICMLLNLNVILNFIRQIINDTTDVEYPEAEKIETMLKIIQSSDDQESTALYLRYLSNLYTNYCNMQGCAHRIEIDCTIIMECIDYVLYNFRHKFSGIRDYTHLCELYDFNMRNIPVGNSLLDLMVHSIFCLIQNKETVNQAFYDFLIDELSLGDNDDNQSDSGEDDRSTVASSGDSTTTNENDVF